MPSKLLLYGSLPPPFTGQSAMFVPVVGMFPKEEILLILGRWCNKRMIAHLHGANFRSFYENSGMLKPFIRYGYRHVDTGIVLLEEMRNEFGHFPNIRVQVVPNCYDRRFDLSDTVQPDTSAPLSVRRDGQPGDAQPDTLVSLSVRSAGQMDTSGSLSVEKFDLKEKNPYQILFLSALMRSKGILEFMEACDIVLQQHAWVNFVIAGLPEPDPFMSRQEIAARFHEQMERLEKSHSGRVAYLGQVVSDHRNHSKHETNIPEEGIMQEKIRLMRDSSIFVLPTWHPSEALPVSILEAMRTGNAIIATRHNFLPSIVKPANGILVEPLSGRAIADAILTLLSDRERLREMQEFNIMHAVENYSIGKYRKNIMEIIKPE